jgi:hypothetical protein
MQKKSILVNSIVATIALLSTSGIFAIEARAAFITAVFPTSQGQPVNLDLANEGFNKIGSTPGNPSLQVNTSGRVISAITHVGTFTGVTETANGTNYYQLQSAAHSIDDNFGANSFDPSNAGANTSGDGFTFTIANNALPQTVNVYVGQFDAVSLLTVA